LKDAFRAPPDDLEHDGLIPAATTAHCCGVRNSCRRCSW
jgi:hypothetical protein